MLGLIGVNTLLGYSSATTRLREPDQSLALLNFAVWGLTFAVLPLAMGFAILKYRLWEIDRLVSRTFIYGVLWLGIVLAYVGLALGLAAPLHFKAAWLAEPGLAGAHDCLRSIRHLQLAEDGGHVVADSLDAHHKLLGDLLIGPTVGNEPQDLVFALGQLGKRQRRRPAAGEVAQQPLGDTRAEYRLASADGINRAHHVLQSRILQKVTSRTGSNRGEHRIVIEHRQDQHTNARVLADDATGGFDAARTRHLEVHQHHIRL
jgi:hypothetical protein